MPRKNVKKFYFYENPQNGGHQIPEKILENQLKNNFAEQGITHVNVVLAVPFQMQNWFQGPPTTRDTGKQREKFQNQFSLKTQK